MKKLFVFIFNLLIVMSLAAQNWYMVDNKGNRTQTYPQVNATNPDIEAMMSQVDTLNMYNSIAWMQQYIRDAESLEALITQNWLVEQYESMGLEPSVHYFINNVTNDSLEAGNVYVVQYGSIYPDEYIIVSSHYDHPDGPGADDNASGTAGVLEIARILSQYTFDRSIIYINFNCEENGGFGSLGFAQDCALQNKNIIGVFNLDMIGWYPPELDTIKMYTSCYHLTQNLYDYYTSVANLYLPETPTLWLTDGEYGAGDHQRFYINDYPAIYIGDIEYLDQHPCYHRSCDTIGSGVNNFALAGAFVKATIAATAELANGKLPPQNLASTSDKSKIYVRWDEADYASEYKLFKDNELLTVINGCYYEDEYANDGQIHDYYVVAVGPDGKESNVSNHDKTKTSPPLEIPFSNDFNENTDGLRFFDTVWTRDDAISLVSTYNDRPEITIVETDWFSIPADALNTTLCFDYLTRNIFNFMQGAGTARILIEATIDRIYWHKIKQITATYWNWRHEEISLDEFIGEPYVQVRIVVEEMCNVLQGPNPGPVETWASFDNFTIDFILDIPDYQSDRMVLYIISPNPTRDFISIVFAENAICHSVEIYSLDGRLIMTFHGVYQQDSTIDISSLTTGIYLLKLTMSDGSEFTERLIKE